MAARAITGASRRGKSALLRPERSFGAEQAAPPLRVIKFGGSSVGNADAFRGVHKVLRYYAPGGRSKAKVVCVLSAMMGVTDKLISAAEEAAKGNESGSLAMREKLYGLHARTVEDLLFDVHAQVKLKDYVEQILQETFDAQVAAIAEKGELELHRMDAMAAIGETLSNTMMSQYLSSTGTASETVYAHDEFIKTTADAGGASADIDASVPLIRAKLMPMLEAGILPCVTGFIASDQAGNLTTLGRGGSDLTASIVGNATDATEVILSKVESEKDSKEGFMTAWKPGWIGIVHQNNPNLTIKNMSFEEAGELGNLGRKVLHRHAVYPLLEKRIPIRICNTLDGNHPGTLISDPQSGSFGSGQSLFGDPEKPVTEITMVELEKFNSLRTKDEPTLAPSGSGVFPAGSTSSLYMVALIGKDIRSNDEVTEKAAQILSAHGIKQEVPGRDDFVSDNSMAFLVEQDKVEDAMSLLFEHFLRPPRRLPMDAF